MEYMADKCVSSCYADSPKLDPKATTTSSCIVRIGSSISRHEEVASHAQNANSVTCHNSFRCAHSAK